MSVCPTAQRWFKGQVVVGAFFVAAAGVASNTISVARAQEIAADEPLSLGIAQHVQLNVTNAQNGQIISQIDDQYSLSNEPYDKAMIGVVANTPPAVSFTPKIQNGGTPIVVEGVVPVLVSGINGPIQEGNRITSSGAAGIGMKAVKSGFILGVAQTSFEPQDATDVGLVMVMLDVKFSFAEDAPQSEQIGQRLIDVLSLSSIAAIQEPLEVLKYLVAGLSLIIGIALTGFTFLQSAIKGVEAIGRNPLASRSIGLGIFANVIASTVIIGSSVVVAYLVITL